MNKVFITTAVFLALSIVACEKKSESPEQKTSQMQAAKNNKMKEVAVAKTKEVVMEADFACAFATDKQACLKNFSKQKTSQELTKQINKI